jgi:hypothetical protein
LQEPFKNADQMRFLVTFSKINITLTECDGLRRADFHYLSSGLSR